MYALSPAVKTVPENRSSSRAVASAPGVPQNPMSPAPTRTPLEATGPKLSATGVGSGVGATGAGPLPHEAISHTNGRSDTRRVKREEQPIRFHALHRRTRNTPGPERKADHSAARARAAAEDYCACEGILQDKGRQS